MKLSDFSTEALWPEHCVITQPESIYRLYKGDDRWYYLWNEEEPEFYLGITTKLGRAMPDSPFITQWKIEQALQNGYANAWKDYTINRSVYGTFMHSEFQELLVTREYNFDETGKRLEAFLKEKNYPREWMAFEDSIKSDILALAKWIIDCDVVPLAIEYPIVSRKWKFISPIDLIAEFNIEDSGYYGETYKSGAKKGQPKLTKQTFRIRGIIDFKSGRKGFYTDHVYQLHAYREAWNENFHDDKIARIFNWSPKNWRTEPDYNFTEQTDKVNEDKFAHYMQLGDLEFKDDDLTTVLVEGKLNLADGYQNVVKNVSYKEIVKGLKNDMPSDSTPKVD